MDEFQGLTKNAEDILSAGHGDHRLDDEQLLQLRLHVKMIASWVERVPQRTRFRFVEWQPVLVVPRVEGFSKAELGIAAFMHPLHSQMGAIALQTLWKANQFIRTLSAALD